MSGCMMCGISLTIKNVICCWETECQDSREFGEYCSKCYPDHVKAHHPRLTRRKLPKTLTQKGIADD